MIRIRVIRAIKESFIDTFVAIVMNFPINYVILKLVIYYEMSAFDATVMMSTVFTIIALIRKTLIRLHFEKIYNKKETADG